MLQLNEKAAASAIAEEKSAYSLKVDDKRAAPDRQKLKQILVQECIVLPRLKEATLLELLL